jgi:hypothetical protein
LPEKKRGLKGRVKANNAMFYLAGNKSGGFDIHNQQKHYIREHKIRNSEIHMDKDRRKLLRRGI